MQAIKTTGISETLRDELKRCEQRKATLEQTNLELQQRQPQTLSLPSTQKIAAALGNLSEVLESGNPRDRKTVLEDNIEQILVQPTGEVLLKANAAGLLALPHYSFCMVPKEGLQPNGKFAVVRPAARCRSLPAYRS